MRLKTVGDAGMETDALVSSRMNGLAAWLDMNREPADAGIGKTRVQLRLTYGFYRKLE